MQLTVYQCLNFKTMEKELTHNCHYYKGEQQNPFEGIDQNKAMLWFYESVWARETSQPNSDCYASIVDEYNFAGLTDFEQGDGVPLSLKALLFNRYCKGCYSMLDAVEPFKKFYREYYIKKEPTL